jgi:general secretion pathway protein K
MKTASNFRSQISNLSSERGVALVLVLWIFIFLFVVALGFTSAVREDGTAAHRYAVETEGYYLALAGFQEGLYLLLTPQVSEGRGTGPGSPLMRAQEVVDGTWREGSLGAGSYRVRFVDEGGKITINLADEETLRRIFTNIGIEEPQRAILVDSILDWRDNDNLHRLNGAEDDYYLSLSPPYTAKNGPFDAVEELLWVRGVTPELFFGQGEGGSDTDRRVGLRDIFSVDSAMDRVNLRTAPAEVIHAVTGLSLERSRAFVEERRKLSEKTLADVLGLLGIAAGDQAQRQFGFTAPSTITLEARGSPPGSALESRVKGVIRVVGGNRGLELIRWVDKDIGMGSE